MLRQMPVSIIVTRQSRFISPRSCTFLPPSEMTQSPKVWGRKFEEEVLDDVGLVAEAQNEVVVPVVGIVLHDVIA